MPGFNGTGPMGEGPMTGGGRGSCNPVNTEYGRQFPETTGFGRGMGFRRGARGGGFGLGMKRGYGWGVAQNQPGYAGTAANALNELKADVAAVKTVLEKISLKITALETT
ncbi:MAG: DUF5320 domain-containing protein [bacterium]|nr:DUF5320 domain-containing protein [bacterium]